MQATKVDYHISPNCKEREYLTEEELKTVITHEFEDKDLSFVRDIFVFVCLSVLSFAEREHLRGSGRKVTAIIRDMR